MSRKSLSLQILDALGGVDNILEFENCMTRLRVSVKDPSKVNREAFKSIKGVLKVVGRDEEPQIILGPGVADEVSSELKSLPGLNYLEGKPDGAIMQKRSATGIFEFFAKVFAPLIPVFAGTGLLFGIMKIFTLIFNLTEMQIFNPAAIANGGSIFMTVLAVLSSTFFTYLNIAVAIQAAKVMGGNPYLGLIAGGIIINVGGLNGVAMGVVPFSFANGRGGTLAALAAGVLIAIVEKWVKKRCNDALKVHLPTMISVIVVGLVTLYVLQPVAGVITDVVAKSLIWLFNYAGAIGGAIVSGLFLPLVMTGLHHSLTPVHTALITEFGYSTLYAYNSMAGAGQVGAAIALYFKYRQYKKIKQAVSGALPAGVLGIGEPLIFGLSLPLGRVFITACLGAAIGGFVIGWFPGMGAQVINVSGILGMLVNTKPLVYLLGYTAAVLGGFGLTWMIGAKKSNLDAFNIED